MPRAAVRDNRRLALRIDSKDKSTLLRAVALLKTDMTDFIVRTALREAEAVIAVLAGVVLFGRAGAASWVTTATNRLRSLRSCMAVSLASSFKAEGQWAPLVSIGPRGFGASQISVAANPKQIAMTANMLSVASITL